MALIGKTRPLCLGDSTLTGGIGILLPVLNRVPYPADRPSREFLRRAAGIGHRLPRLVQRNLP
jgi:hypothetical protein